MVSVRMGELRFRFVCFFSLRIRSEVRIRYYSITLVYATVYKRNERLTREHSGDTENLIRAFEFGRDDQHFRELRFERESGHDITQRGQVYIISISHSTIRAGGKGD